MKYLSLMLVLFTIPFVSCDKLKRANNETHQRHRILVSTDIGGTDPDDNQSMIHLLMYSCDFDIEGIISSPSYGEGSKAELLHMIDEYEQDQSQGNWAEEYHYPSADVLRKVCKQGRHGRVPLCGYDQPTEGSDWIIECAKRVEDRPLWVLVWGTLDDVAQALHDAPEIASDLRVYWIGGPNKKWGANAYNYIVENFPHLWFIENNATYRGFMGDKRDSSYYQAPFWENCMKGHGVMCDDFVHYYGGIAKMGDTPSLLYLMGQDSIGHPFNPEDPTTPHWGGQFERMTLSPKYIVTGPLTGLDHLPVFSLMEWRLQGPEMNIPMDSACFSLHVANQEWDGYYIGDGIYMVRYAAKAAGTLDYEITSQIPGFPVHTGIFRVCSSWLVEDRPLQDPYLEASHIRLGSQWWTDICASTNAQWRNAIMADWEERIKRFHK